METTANVWLLPTTVKGSGTMTSEAKDMFICKQENFGKQELFFRKRNDLFGIPQHLYITLPQSDLEISKIKEGDWCINKNGDTLYQPNLLGDYSGWEKIMATRHVEVDKVLPLIPQSFIKHLISEYNKRNFIKQVKIELELSNYDDWMDNGASPVPKEKLKLNQQNEISIVVPEKKKYSIEEVRENSMLY